MKTKTHFAFRVDVWDDTGVRVVFGEFVCRKFDARLSSITRAP
jgi:hypothetical protein